MSLFPDPRIAGPIALMEADFRRGADTRLIALPLSCHRAESYLPAHRDEARVAQAFGDRGDTRQGLEDALM